MRVRTAGGEEEEPWGHTSLERRAELNKRYKDKVEKLWAAGCWERPSPRLRPSPAGADRGGVRRDVRPPGQQREWEQTPHLDKRLDFVAVVDWILYIPWESQKSLPVSKNLLTFDRTPAIIMYVA